MTSRPAIAGIVVFRGQAISTAVKYAIKTFANARAVTRIVMTALAGLLAAYPAVALDSSQCPNATQRDNAGCMSVARTLNGGEVTPPTTHTVTITNVCTDYAIIELL